MIALATGVGWSTSTLAQAPPAQQTSDPPLWNPDWTPVQPWQWVLSAGVFLMTEVAFQANLYDDTIQPDWRGGILVDDAFRRCTRISTRSGRDRANELSDAFGLWGVNYAFLDIALTAIVHDDARIAVQLGGMLLQSTAAANFTVRMMQLAVRRERPLGRECDDDPAYDALCDEPERYTSFWSGHTAGAFTGAGLTCAWHVHMPLYGGGWLDAVPCATSLLAATVQGYLRIASDRHYLSDVLVGAGVGFFLGYGLPALVHFTGGEADLALVPLAADGTFGLAVGGPL